MEVHEQALDQIKALKAQIADQHEALRSTTHQIAAVNAPPVSNCCDIEELVFGY